MNTIVRYRDAILLFLPFSPYNTTCLATDTANDNTRVLILTAHLDDQCVLFSHLTTSVCKRNNGDDLGLFADRVLGASLESIDRPFRCRNVLKWIVCGDPQEPHGTVK